MNSTLRSAIATALALAMTTTPAAAGGRYELEQARRACYENYSNSPDCQARAWQNYARPRAGGRRYDRQDYRHADGGAMIGGLIGGLLLGGIIAAQQQRMAPAIVYNVPPADCGGTFVVQPQLYHDSAIGAYQIAECYEE